MQYLSCTALLTCALCVMAEDCGSSAWCVVPMPTKSFFGFGPPSDQARWHQAQVSAARGEHSILVESLKHFTQANDFLDGDISFKYIHFYTDIFLDRETGFSALTGGAVKVKSTRGYWRHASYEPVTRIPIVMAGYGMIAVPRQYICLSHRCVCVLQVNGVRNIKMRTARQCRNSFLIDSVAPAWASIRSQRTSSPVIGISIAIKSARSIYWL